MTISGSVPAGHVPLSVVIATHNRPRQLDECLKRLAAEDPRPAEIVVVDNAPKDDESARVAAAHGIRYVRLEIAGVCLARNAGWRAATNEFVGFIDDDIRIHRGWSKALVDALAQDGVDFVTGWIGVPPGQESAQDPQPLMIEPDPRRLDRTTREHMGGSANMGARRAALARVGGFDERLGPGTWFAAAEDDDLFDRFVLAGCVGLYTPDVRTDHEAWRGRRERLRQHWSYGKGTGARIRLLLGRDRRRALHEAQERLWRRGFVQALVRVGQRWAMGAACSLARLTGGLLGFFVALVTLRGSWPDDVRPRH